MYKDACVHEDLLTASFNSILLVSLWQTIMIEEEVDREASKF